MGYAEIIAANRRQHEGTFMDRSWRDNPDTNGESVLNNADLTFWQKLTNGAYTYQAISARFVKGFQITQTKVKFIEEILEHKADYSNEKDQLLIKRTELAIGRKYNYFRAPFMAASATVCLLSLFNTKLGLVKRFIPVFIFTPLITFYNKNIGMYGVHSQIDDILELMVGDEGIQVKDTDCKVRQLTKQFVKDAKIDRFTKTL